jgi:8-hydroxy-5-deazaflavin:NADPH oxidoreductase
MGGALGRLLGLAGHDVMFSGASDAARLSGLAEQVGGQWGGVADAAGFGDVVVLSVRWEDVRDAVRAAGDLTGRVVLSTVNALTPDLSGLAVGHTTSAAEQIAALVAGCARG